MTDFLKRFAKHLASIVIALMSLVIAGLVLIGPMIACAMACHYFWPHNQLAVTLGAFTAMPISFALLVTIFEPRQIPDHKPPWYDPPMRKGG